MLHIGKGFTLNDDAVTQTFAILAKRGAGKSYLASVMAEEMLDRGQPIVAIDPTGAWHGLKSGYPVVVFGGDHGDLPLQESAGVTVATAIVQNRFPAIIDLSLFTKGAQIRFMIPFAETLYRLNREALHLFVDEADDLVPQRMQANEARLVGAMEDIVKRGRKKGIGCSLITQRPADIAKQVLTQCEVLVALRIVHHLDIKAVMEWVRVKADADTAKSMIETLPNLPIGEAWFWSPGWGDFFQRVQVRKRKTFDSGATPKAGEKRATPPKLVPVDLKSLGEQIRIAEAELKSNDPKLLKAEIERLKKELAAKPTVKPEIREVPVLSEKESQFMKLMEEHLKKLRDDLPDVCRIWRNVIEQTHPVAVPARNNGRTFVAEAVRDFGKRFEAAGKVERGDMVYHKPDGRITARPDELSGLERALLTVLAQHPAGLTKTAACVYAGYRPSGDISTAWSRFAGSNWISRTANGVKIEQAGLDALGSYDPMPTGAELREHWLAKVDKHESGLLKVLFDCYPNGMTKGEIIEAAGYRPSGDISSAWSKFNVLGWTHRTANGVRASDMWFN